MSLSTAVLNPMPRFLNAPSVPVALEGGLLPLESLTNPITISFDVWDAAEPSYTYELIFDGKDIPPQKVILPTDVPGDHLTLEIPVALLEEGLHTVAYRVYSPFADEEVISESTPVIIDKTAPGSPQLGPIIFPDLIQNGLTSSELETLGNMLPGKIASYRGMAVGDVIRTYWGNLEGPSVDVSANDMGLKRVMVDFTRPFLEQVGDIEADVYYTVTDLAGNLSMPSDHLKVSLQLAAVTLRAPTMDTVGPDGVLDPSHIPETGATVRVGYEAMLADDQVVTHWIGASAYHSPAQIVGAGAALVFILPKELIIASQGRSATLNYSVLRNGVLYDSEVLTLNVSSALTLDPSPVTLAAKIYLLPDYSTTLPAFPENAQITRTASGGLPPYTYTSSDEKVANVDSSGLTTVRGNGSASISVTDASGQRLAYQVTVSGVIACFGLGSGKFQAISAVAGNNGTRLPSIQELREIHSAYGNRWPMGNNTYWSSTVARPLTPFGKTYYVKNLVGGFEVDAYTYSNILGVGLR